ncbi:RidA family protein [Proteocatella sphenisci]|uniref:RidA family protein n=1 Tax=Proteocatella sphenisci TaxID=181070 RepID=UPI00048CECEF|nr:RidA family protein [Proteocatella sphenisci]
MKNVVTSKAPAAIGPYSQGMDIGNLVFTSGQLPLNMETGEMETEIKAATKASLTNVEAIFAQAGLTMNDVIKTTVFISDMNNFAAMNEVYATFFGEIAPARSCVEVARLPKDVLVEIEAIAVRK